MRKTEIRVEGVEAFFERGRKYARLADCGERIPESRIIAFEDVETLLSVLTEKRVTLIKQVKQKPGSITVLASRLGRDRSAVTRDVQLLERAGVIRVTLKTLPGHGKQKWISPVARSIQLTAEL
jgi:predicted transcriptional regulator